MLQSRLLKEEGGDVEMQQSKPISSSSSELSTIYRYYVIWECIAINIVG